MVEWWGASNGVHFAMLAPCLYCNCKGVKIGANPAFQKLDEMKCEHCNGQGSISNIMTFAELVNYLAPHIAEVVSQHLPNIIERAKVEVVRQIMES
jgi:hypothetical protein